MPRAQSVCSIINEDPTNENRCTGHRRDGLPCNNVVALASRKSAHSLLRQCAGLPSNSNDLYQNFRIAAGLLLCKRWHQNQAGAVASRWLRAWEAYEDNADSGYGSSEEEREEYIPRYPRRASNSRHPAEQPSVPNDRSAYDNLLLALMASGISETTRASILDTAASLSRSNNSRRVTFSALEITFDTANIVSRRLEPAPRSFQSPSSPQAEHNHMQSSTNLDRSARRGHASTSQQQDAVQQSTRSAHRHSHDTTSALVQRNSSQQGTGTTRNTQRSPTVSPAEPSTSQQNTDSIQRRNRSQTPSPSLPSPTLPSANRSQTLNSSRVQRASHEDCGICMEPYGDAAVWECRRCRNRICFDCYESWNTHLFPATMTCVYCRAPARPLL